MRLQADRSVVLTADEATAVAKVLDLSYRLAEMMCGSEAGSEGTLEAEVVDAIDSLDTLGVSAQELTRELVTPKNTI